MKPIFLIVALFAFFFLGCQTKPTEQPTGSAAIEPAFVTDTTLHDTDDPAIWIHPTDPARSLLIGTDKDEDGALYVFDLQGKIIRRIGNLKRPNNVDIEYGLRLNDTLTDIVVTTERLTHQLRIFRLPDFKPLDNGGIPVFENETGAEFRDLMGVALYKNPSNDSIYAIVGRKNGPKEGYLWQYHLSDDGTGNIKASLVRKFGAFSQNKEIEAIAVDDRLGYVYYSDEGVGVRKYYADPTKGNQELALFATSNFTDDHEGISIYPTSDTTGYLLVSDQQANQFHVFTREGSPQNPHEHRFLKALKVSTNESDGSEVTAVRLNDRFPKGLFVAMSDNKTFQIYDWQTLERVILSEEKEE